MCVSPKEGVIAVGSESGRIHVIAFSSSPSPLVHLLTRDSRRLSKVTSLAWSTDSKTLYSGHANGLVLAHHTGTNYFFRSSCTTLATFNDGEIVQLDVNSSKILVSTQRASYICDIDGKNIVQIGKKLRNGPMGACFFPSCSETSTGTDTGFVLAARPNGRVWESNFAGVVYRTHLLRDNVAISSSPVISCRSNYTYTKNNSSATTTTTDHIQLGILREIVLDDMPFVLSVFGSHLVIFDVEQSKIVLLSDLEEDITCWCVCGSDVFLLLRGTSIPRKYTLCCRTTVLKKLLAKSLFTQSAAFILHFKTCSWPNDLINIAVESLPQTSKEAEVERLRRELSNLLQKQKNSELDDTDEIEGAQTTTEIRSVSGQQKSGSYSGEVKTTARTTRIRMRSASHDHKSTASRTVPKRASFPQSATEMRCDFEHNPLNMEAENVVINECNWDSRHQIVESDSLKTLLQLGSSREVEAVQFVPTITIGNAAKSLAQLAISTPTSFSCFEANGNDTTPPSTPSKDSSTIKRRYGPNIVKAVRPCKSKPVASVAPISSKRFAKSSPTGIQSSEVSVKVDVSDESNNQINANNLQRISTTPVEKEAMISLHDNENNVEVHWVIDRLVNLQSEIVPTSQLVHKLSQSPSSLIYADYCDQCKIHRSWLVAALLARVCKRIKVISDFTKPGGVPSMRNDWKEVLEFRFSSYRNRRSPCARCETALCRCLAIFRQGRDSLDLAPENVQPSRKKAYERCMSIDEDRLFHILLGSCFVSSDEETSKNGSPLLDGSDAHSVAISENGTKYPNKTKTFDQEGSHDRFQEMLSTMDWLLNLDPRVIMAIASLVIGYHELISIIKESPSLLSALLPEHWSALTFLCVRDQAMKRNEISPKVISEILHGFSLDRFVNVDSSNTVVIGKLDSAQKQAPMYSWIIDCNNCCPICTLSLKSDVGKDLAVTSFICGHAYHTVCLSGRFATCLVCRGRAKERNSSRISRVSKLE
ncbi:hypothetical protein KIN20_016782 [Parelaphostrongylus tenuis]|uniref:RING-type domain-containing protein n=1 Tax=Parelaphostrongylus tenuis TaxID=148309 RepID=A0AAD5N1R4_PARTN|nr:hypothetical protein KIN20_016782 [Parelaphostrongylus tenuis]